MMLSPRSLRSVVYGDGVELDDAAETYHEASKAYPSFLAREVAGVARLEASPELQHVVRRSVRGHRGRPRVVLPPPELPEADFAELLGQRRSRRGFTSAPVPVASLGAMLHAGYGVTSDGPERLRAVPSGGALYPLEVYVAASQVDRLEQGLYHYDPFDHVLERLAVGDRRTELREALVYPELADAALLVLVTAVFWRSRFKYGLRAYRFALLEAGHLVQNLLLACTALALAAVPLGGFYDTRLERMLGVDGVNESVVYGAAVGHRSFG